jgi:hypothetical protein
MNIGELYLESVIKRFNDYKNLGDRTFAQLNDEDMHYQPDKESNSIAIIIQHVHGNMLSRWTNFLTEDGEKEWRQRDDEFELHSFSKGELLKRWEEGWKVLLSAISFLKSDDLGKTILIRKEPHTVIDAINRQLAHIPSHVGQIVYLGKLIKSESWQTLSIPKKGSREFNEKMMGKKL